MDNVDNEEPNLVPQQEGLPLIQDLDHYLQQNGLGHSDPNNNETTEDQREFAARMKQAESYKDGVLREFLEKDTLANQEKAKGKLCERNRIVKLCRDKKLVLVTAEDTIICDLSLALFVEKCETIYTLAKSDLWLGAMSKGASHIEGYTNQNVHGRQENSIKFSLQQFDQDSIHEFISLLSEKHKSVQEIINPEHIIECCKISHYLQCQSLLDQIVDIIQNSIDESNCASICILADQLQLPSLFHASMTYVMDSLDKIQTHDLWNDFPISLKHHILTLRNAAQSSLIGKGHTSRVVFTSSHEFLGIFHDTLREHKERLEDAKMRQHEIIQERIQLNQRRGRYSHEIDVYGGDVKDAAGKIEKQEKRVKTLETFYKEQKEIFSRDASSLGDGVFQSQFEL